MAILQIPSQSDIAAFQYSVTLDGTNYILEYYFNDRMSKWFLTLMDINSNVLVGPVPIVATWPLFDRFIDLNIPPGTIFAFDTSGQNLDPGQFDLGSRVVMMYAEAGTLEAAS